MLKEKHANFFNDLVGKEPKAPEEPVVGYDEFDDVESEDAIEGQDHRERSSSFDPLGEDD